MSNIPSFGKAISVLGTGIGFPGTAARLGDRIVKARVNSNVSLNINFGDSCLLIPDSEGGSWQSVADFMAHGGSVANAEAYWAGIAFREVQTMYTYPENVVPGTNDPVGFYPPGVETEVMERGSIAVKIAAGTPLANMSVFLRLVANPLVPGSAIGDFEAAADGSNTYQLPSVRFSTGVLDANGVAEITLMKREAA